LKDVWRVSNGLRYARDWRVYPVFDRGKPKKSWGHIVEENSKTTYDYFPEGLLRIASDSYGNYLVLKVEGGIARPTVYRWDHETANLKKSPVTLGKLLEVARKRRSSILKKIERSKERSARR
jgi:hypothetical protein